MHSCIDCNGKGRIPPMQNRDTLQPERCCDRCAGCGETDDESARLAEAGICLVPPGYVEPHRKQPLSAEAKGWAQVFADALEDAGINLRREIVLQTMAKLRFNGDRSDEVRHGGRVLGHGDEITVPRSSVPRYLQVSSHFEDLGEALSIQRIDPVKPETWKRAHEVEARIQFPSWLRKWIFGLDGIDFAGRAGLLLVEDYPHAATPFEPAGFLWAGRYNLPTRWAVAEHQTAAPLPNGAIVGVLAETSREPAALWRPYDPDHHPVGLAWSCDRGAVRWIEWGSIADLDLVALFNAGALVVRCAWCKDDRKGLFCPFCEGRVGQGTLGPFNALTASHPSHGAHRRLQELFLASGRDLTIQRGRWVTTPGPDEQRTVPRGNVVTLAFAPGAANSAEPGAPVCVNQHGEIFPFTYLPGQRAIGRVVSLGPRGHAQVSLFPGITLVAGEPPDHDTESPDDDPGPFGMSEDEGALPEDHIDRGDPDEQDYNETIMTIGRFGWTRAELEEAMTLGRDALTRAKTASERQKVTELFNAIAEHRMHRMREGLPIRSTIVDDPKAVTYDPTTSPLRAAYPTFKTATDIQRVIDEMILRRR